MTQELEVVEAKIKIFNERRTGIKKILKLEKFTEIVGEVVDEIMEEPLEEQPADVPASYKVPLSFDFHMLSGDDWKNVTIKNFVKGDIVRAVKANRIVPVHGKEELTVIGIEGEYLLIQK